MISIEFLKMIPYDQSINTSMSGNSICTFLKMIPYDWSIITSMSGNSICTFLKMIPYDWSTNTSIHHWLFENKSKDSR